MNTSVLVGPMINLMVAVITLAFGIKVIKYIWNDDIKPKPNKKENLNINNNES